jgi:hypothetical protein
MPSLNLPGYAFVRMQQTHYPQDPHKIGRRRDRIDPIAWRRVRMSSENPVADRLVSDARKKETQPTSSPLNIAALTSSIVGLAAASWVPIVSMLGLVGVILGIVSSRKPGNNRMAWGAVAVGAVAVAVGIGYYILRSTGVV